MAVLKRYDGSQWVTPVLRRYDGTTWECVDLNRHNGSSWVDVETACAPYVEEEPPPEEFDPADIAGLLGWWEADALVQADNTDVASWTDSSVNGRNLSPNGTTPKYRTGIQNGLPAIRLTDGYFTVNLGTATQPNTVFLVASQEASSYRYVMDGSGASNRHSFGRLLPDGAAWPDMTIYAGGSFVSQYGLEVPTGIHLWTCLFNGASSTLRRDGAQIASGNAGAHSTTSVVLGANHAGGDRMQGYIAEVLWYNAALSSTDRDAVEAYLTEKWGL